MKPSERLNNVLLRLVGVRHSSVENEKFAEVRSRYVALALVTIMVSVLAGNSMGFAAYTLTGSAWVYLAVAAVWFLFILTVESFLIVTLKPNFSPASLVAIGMRLAMALLISQLASRPYEMQIFKAEIANEISTSSSKELTADMAAFEKEYAPKLKELAQQRAPIQDKFDKLEDECELKYKAYIDEWKGVPGDNLSGRFGEGKWTKLNKMQYDRCQSELDREKDENRSDSLVAQLKDFDEQVEKVKAERDARLKARETAIAANNGLLARIAALDRLTEKNSEVKLVVWLLRLFVVVLETLPITGKIFMVFSPFERLRGRKEDAAVRAEDQSIKAESEMERQGKVTQLAEYLREQEFNRSFSGTAYARARQGDEFEAAAQQRAKDLVAGLGKARKPEPAFVKVGARPSSNGNGKH